LRKSDILLKRKWVSPVSFAIAAVAFFFSFLNLTYYSGSVSTVSGIELATGACTLNSVFEELIESATQPASLLFYQSAGLNYFAIAAILLATGGMVLSLLLFLQQEMLLGIIGLAGVFTMLLMRLQIDSQWAILSTVTIKNQLKIEYAFGYWTAIAFFLVAGLTNLSVYIDQLNTPTTRKRYSKRFPE
jgi:hypothetical protein